MMEAGGNGAKLRNKRSGIETRLMIIEDEYIEVVWPWCMLYEGYWVVRDVDRVTVLMS